MFEQSIEQSMSYIPTSACWTLLHLSCNCCAVQLSGLSVPGSVLRQSETPLPLHSQRYSGNKCYNALVKTILKFVHQPIGDLLTARSNRMMREIVSGFVNCLRNDFKISSGKIVALH